MQLDQFPEHYRIEYLTIVGSHAYGVATEDSDIDVYGFLTPELEFVFPHTRREIPGFGRQHQRFEQHQGKDPCDYTIYSIVKFFQLCMENNPNMVDALFTPDHCVIHLSNVGRMVREKKELFLHKGSYHKFRGYAHAQMAKLERKVGHENPRRAASMEQHGYDTKYAYHLVRLLYETREILNNHTLVLDKYPGDLMRIRNGEYTLEYIKDWFNAMMVTLERDYEKSTLRYEPDQEAIQQLLVDCLEERFGSLERIGYGIK